MVGAHVEEVAPRRFVLPADFVCLALLLAAAAILHGLLMARTSTTARDSIRFARTALNFQSPSSKTGSSRTAVDVLRDARECPDPPAFPLAVLGVSCALKTVYHAPTPILMLKSAQIAANISAVLLIFPCYWLGRLLFRSAFAGFAAALLFQVLPTVAHITSDGLSDSTSLLCILTSLTCAARALRSRSTLWFLLAGLASGCGYLVRPEGMIAGLALAAVTAVLALKRTWPREQCLGRLAALGAGLAIVAAPYMMLIGGISNKPSVNEPLKKLMPFRATQVNAAPPGVLFAEWYNGQGSQLFWAAKAIVKETGKASHYAVFGLGLLGLFWHRRQIASDPAFALVLVAGLFHLMLLFLLAMKPMPEIGPGIEAVPPYVSERHTLFLVAILCLFTGGLLASNAPPHLGSHHIYGCLLLAGLIASALPPALRPLHENRVGHLHAGMHLAGLIGPNEAVIDPFEWAHWYSGHSLYGVPADPPDDKLTARWVIWEPTAGTKQNPHSRLPRLEAARQVVEDTNNSPTLIYQWPDEGEPKVVIYKQTVRK